jgi:hypothetical protein
MRSDIEQTLWNLAAGAAGGAVRHLMRFVADPGRRWPALLAGSITGVFCAVFLTPMIASQFEVFGDPTKATGLAFLLGVLGMEGVELMIDRLRKVLGADAKGQG